MNDYRNDMLALCTPSAMIAEDGAEETVMGSANMGYVCFQHRSSVPSDMGSCKDGTKTPRKDLHRNGLCINIRDSLYTLVQEQ